MGEKPRATNDLAEYLLCLLVKKRRIAGKFGLYFGLECDRALTLVRQAPVEGN